jgi:hypothetical protein
MLRQDKTGMNFKNVLHQGCCASLYKEFLNLIVGGYPSNSLAKPMMGPMTFVMKVLMLQMTTFIELPTKLHKQKMGIINKVTGISRVMLKIG